MGICKVLLNKEDMRYTVSFDNGECKQSEELTITQDREEEE